MLITPPVPFAIHIDISLSVVVIPRKFRVRMNPLCPRHLPLFSRVVLLPQSQVFAFMLFILHTHKHTHLFLALSRLPRTPAGGHTQRLDPPDGSGVRGSSVDRRVPHGSY